MKKKLFIILLFILFALPIPIAILGFAMSFIWFMASLVKGSSFVEIITALCGTIVGATYLFTYISAFIKTWKEKKICVKTFLPVVHCLLAFLFLLSLKPIASYISNTTEYFGFAKKDFSVVEELDTHGGFLGDGSYYLILDCAEKKEQALTMIESWEKLPLSENLNLIMYGRYRLAEKAKIPRIENGYYIFEDRHSESKDSRDDSELFDRHSYNFSIAFYDCDTDQMYFFAFDT